MTTAERSSQTLEIEKMYVDVGATSREEVENVSESISVIR